MILELVSPLLAKVDRTSALDQARAMITLGVTFWNASVLASNRWEYPELKELNALKKRMRGRLASRDARESFDLLTPGWRKHWLDPRLVDSWTYEQDSSGDWRLQCSMGLPEGVEAKIPPAREKRVAIGGAYLDELRISLGGSSQLVFPTERHRGVVAEDGSAIVHTMMPSALQLMAAGYLTPVTKGPVDVAIGGWELGPMELVEVRCADGLRHEVAILMFRPVAIRS